MVHSGSASPMNTSPAAPPHLSATAPPLVPSPRDTSDPGPTSACPPQPSTPTPADAEPPAVTKALTGSSSPASSWSSTESPAQGPFNGRTSGRKRTPKACDCCGPNSRGHDVKASSRGRGRGRGPFKDLWDTPKRKGGAQLTCSHSFDLTKDREEEEEEEEEDESDTSEKGTGVMADPPPPVTPPQDGPIRNCGAPEKACEQGDGDMSMKGTGGSGDAAKACGVNREAELRPSGTPARRAPVVRGRGRGIMTGAMFASKMKVEVRIQSQGGSFSVTGSKGGASGPSVLAQSLEDNKDVQMEQGVHSSSFKSPFCNGDTVNLTDSESEDEDDANMSKPGNGLLSISGRSGPASRTDGPQSLDSDMDQTRDGTDQGSLPVTLSNGNVPSWTDRDQRATPMEVDTSQCPITVQHCSAIRDHRLYCHSGTWEKMEDASGKDPSAEVEVKVSNEERLEQLTDMVHDFLESFYIKYGSFIPLSETDVLEHLKKNGSSDFSKWGLDVKREMSRYRSGLASAPVAGFVLMHNKHSLGLEDLSTLEEQNWLNDQIINMYGELMMEATQHKVHFFNSFFHKQLVAKGYDGVKRWTKKVDLFSKWLLLFPIHLEIHWSLVTVTMATKTISYYDSQGIVFRHTTDNIMKYLQSEAREKEQAEFQKGWKITIIKGIPQQRNDSDCGVFVLEYCRRLSVKQPLLFSQEDMPLIRKRIYKELCDRRLDD